MNIRSPYITVIMPVYNAENYVREAIESILNQSFGNFEFLIFNDCSTDASAEIIASFNDPRIRIIDSPINTGYVKHLNDGLRLAKGKYIARMDADDISMPDRFQKQVNYLDAHEEVGVCGSYIELIGTKAGVVDFPITHKDIVTHFLLHGNGMAHPSVLMRRSVLEQFEICYDSALEPAEDYDIWIRISDYAKLYNMPEVLLKYRMHDSNESVVKKEKQNQAVRRIREKLYSRWSTHNEVRVLNLLTDATNIKYVELKDLRNVQLFTSNILASELFNTITVRKVLSPIFIVLCKRANSSGLTKTIHYLRFPYYKFSIRTTLNLLFNL